MNNYTFWIPIQGTGDDPKEGWISALESLMERLMRDDSLLDTPPANIFRVHDPIPAAEILGGSLSDGFGMDEGEAKA